MFDHILEKKSRIFTKSHSVEHTHRNIFQWSENIQIRHFSLLCLAEYVFCPHVCLRACVWICRNHIRECRINIVRQWKNNTIYLKGLIRWIAVWKIAKYRFSLPYRDLLKKSLVKIITYTLINSKKNLMKYCFKKRRKFKLKNRK